jgi:hypothetical protein
MNPTERKGERRMPLLNYTTQINPNKTVGEIQQILARAKVQQISIDYDEGLPSAINFMLVYFEQPIYFRLPCNVEGVYAALCKASKVPYRLRTKQQARRVAWRIIKDWIEAQLAIVEAKQAEMVEVFLPYAVDKSGQTFFQMFSESKQKLLSDGN